MNINPQSTFRIVRQLTNPSDTGTYYVQAVVRNSATGATLNTVNLTDGGSQRFTGSFTTPPDGSGNGLYIDITTTVYTNSGYTTKSENYGIEAQTLFVHQQWNHASGLGGGVEVNYEKIRSMIREELQKEKIEIPEQKDITPAMLGMERRIKETVASAVSSIQIPEQVRPDLEGAVEKIRMSLDDALNTLLIAIDNKEVTPETDLTPVLAEVQNLPVQEMLSAIELLNERLTTLQDIVNTQQDVTALKNAAEEFMGKISPRTINIPKEQPVDATRMRAQRLLGNLQTA